MSMLGALARCRRGAAAVEMALVLPLLLVILFGSVELGNYFMNEHSLSKAVRDGARFAARQSFTDYSSCGGSPDGTVVDDTRTIVMNGYLAGGAAVLTPNIEADDIDVTTSCSSTANGEDMLGIYRERSDGAQIVTVSATVDYRSILGSYGFSGIGSTLNASSQAAVTGI